MKTKPLISFLIAFCLVSWVACNKGSPSSPNIPTTPSTPPTSSTPQVGDTATNFSAKDQNGQDVSLSDFSGKVILFEFSADWCGHCCDEAPHLEELYNEYKDRGFQAITLLVDGTPSFWAKTYALTFPVLDDENETIWDVYGEGYVPLNIIVDRNFVIRYKQAGFNESAIRAKIERYL